ncbi:MAG: RNA polymerase sigma factor [Patescibacteria group bacterium]
MNSLRSNLQEKIAFLRLKSGDSDAFSFFYDQYVDRIYRFVFIKVSDKQVAEDLTQDIFLKIWQHLVDKKDIRSFSAFIFRIARNSVVDYYRKSYRQELPLEYLDESQEPADDKAATLDKSMDTETLLKLLRNLKPEYQEVLLLRFVEDLSIEDIAGILQKDKNNVRVLLHRALAKLKSLTINQ